MFTGGRTWLDPVLLPIEHLVLRLTGVDPADQQDWKRYSVSLLFSNVVMWLATWTIVTLQQRSLERSNVDVVTELVNLILAQRAYEFNTRAVRTADNMLSATTDLIR